MKEQESLRRRERVALLKRINNRTYGTRPDAIKLMIKANSERYLRRRLALVAELVQEADSPQHRDDKQQDCSALLTALRAKHDGQGRHVDPVGSVLRVQPPLVGFRLPRKYC